MKPKTIQQRLAQLKPAHPPKPLRAKKAEPKGTSPRAPVSAAGDANAPQEALAPSPEPVAVAGPEPDKGSTTFSAADEPQPKTPEAEKRERFNLPTPAAIRTRGAPYARAFMRDAVATLNWAPSVVRRYVELLVTEARQEIGKLKQQIAAEQTARQESALELARRQAELSTANLSMKKLQADNTRLQAGKDALRKQRDDLQKQLDQKRAIPSDDIQSKLLLAQANAALADTRAQLEQARAQASSLTFQNDNLKTRLAHAQETLAQQSPQRPSRGPDAEPSQPPSPPSEPALPESLVCLKSWAQEHLCGKVTIRQKALEQAMASHYEQPQVVYRALLLLANEYRDLKMGRAKHNWVERLAQYQLVDDFSLAENAPARMREGHTFVIDGKPYYMERHLKKGNSRDPRQCLRIYYAWDAEKEQVMVGALPEHLRTRQT